MQKLLSYMRSACQQYNMISEGDRIAVGVSGGKDSVSCLRAWRCSANFTPSILSLWLSP